MRACVCTYVCQEHAYTYVNTQTRSHLCIMWSMWMSLRQHFYTQAHLHACTAHTHSFTQTYDSVPWSLVTEVNTLQQGDSTFLAMTLNCLLPEMKR